MKDRIVPRIDTKLRSHTVIVPDTINRATGIIINGLSGGKNTVEIIKALRRIDETFPIIATGGPGRETIEAVIEAGTNAVTYTPPTNGEIFRDIMDEYRNRCKRY